MKYTFSVIVPIYNLDKYIKKNIDCVINQTIGFKDNIQLILVDDGSTDYSASICKRYAEKYSDNIIYIYQEHQGIATARNTGMNYISGRYVVFSDGYGQWAPDAFEKICRFFDSHYDEVDVIACRISLFGMGDKYDNLDYRFKQGTRIVDINKTAWAINPNLTASVFKAEEIKETRFDALMHIGEDVKFITELILRKCSYGLLKEAEYINRDLPGSTLRGNKADQFLTASEEYYKGLYLYSIERYGKVLPYIQHLVMNAVRIRVAIPAPKGLSIEQLEQYRENLQWVVKRTSDNVILKMKRGLRNIRLYMLWLKHGNSFYDDLKVQKSTVLYKDIAVGSPLDGSGMFRIDDIFELNGKKTYYCALQLSAFLPCPKLLIKTANGYEDVVLQYVESRSRKSFCGDSLQQVYTCEINAKELPKCKMVIGDFEIVLVPEMPIAEKTSDIDKEYEYSDEEYINKVAEITGEKYEIVLNEMIRVKESIGVGFSDYYHYGMYNLSDAHKYRLLRITTGQRNKRKVLYRKAITDTGMNRAQIDARIAWINKRNIYHVTLSSFVKFELYNFFGKALDNQLELLAERNKLKNELQSDFKHIDKGEKSYADIENKVARIYEIYDLLIPQSLVLKYAKKLELAFPEMCNDNKKLKYVAADIEFCVFVLRFYIGEYFCFRFVEKTLQEKREFICERELVEIYKEIHSDLAYDLLTDKKNTYDLIGDYYKRDVIKISGEDDREVFREFCEYKDIFVFKPLYGAMGKGIRPVTISEYENTDQLFDELNCEQGEWMAEELIKQHDIMKSLNSDSVNTVRLITYFDGHKTIVHRAFAKVGRGGSFVDNGGSGGIFVSVDHKKGVFTTSGCDENGITYDKHPESGIVFKGFKLPKWKKALKLGKKVATKIPEAKYIGWDLAYTEDNEWVIVEGNSRTQFVGQQCTTGKGEKKLFIDLIYKKGRRENDKISERM